MRNRERVLTVAYDVFAAEGLGVPIDEIARRAGVGAGTVYRHFPTKDDLFRAVVIERLAQLIEEGRALLTTARAEDALFEFVRALVLRWGTVDRGLVEALAGLGIDVAATSPQAERGYLELLGAMLEAGQRAGAVRADVSVAEIKALVIGGQAMQRSNPGIAEQTTMLLMDGLRPRP